jgi:putative transposase
MRGPKPKPIELTEEQKEILEEIVRSRTQAHGVVTRAKIVLAAAAGKNNQAIAIQLQAHRGRVRTRTRPARGASVWRARWLAAAERLGPQSGTGLREPIETVLADAPRSGAPATFTPEQLCQLVALACEGPEASGRSVSHWTPPELADEMVKRGLVQQISPRSVGRFLKRGRSQATSIALLADSSARGEPGAV